MYLMPAGKISLQRPLNNCAVSSYYLCATLVGSKDSGGVAFKSPTVGLAISVIGPSESSGPRRHQAVIDGRELQPT